MAHAHAHLVTPRAPGAIGVIHLVGAPAERLPIARRNGLPQGRPLLVQLGDVDQGIVIAWDDDNTFIMPHGGPRVMQRLCMWLQRHGIATHGVESHNSFPEADDACDAIMLSALPRLRGSLGLELLLDQPRRWRECSTVQEADRARAARLNRLLNPPLVVLAGAANVGKSTLSNRLAGRSVSIEADLPGTTRDYTTVLVDLSGLVVRWVDTPGLRAAADALETRAVATAERIMRQTDCLIAITDHVHDWPDLPREAHLRIANKVDLGSQHGADLDISATTGAGVSALVQRVRNHLVPPADLLHPGVWLFDPRLESTLAASR